MIVYAIFMCMQHPVPVLGRDCHLLTTHPMHGPPGVPYENTVITSLAQCKREMRFYGRDSGGWVHVCMRKEIPAWGPAG